MSTLELVDLRHGFDVGFASESTSATTLGPYSCALGTHRYIIDETKTHDWKYASIPILPENSTFSVTLTDEQGENTVNRAGGWRRSVQSWDKGAGQRHLDTRASDPDRFRASLGVNPWERWSLSLLNTTAKQMDSAGAPRLAVAGTVAYATHPTTNQYAYSVDADLVTWTTHAAGATALLDVTSDGAIAYGIGASGIYSLNSGSSALLNAQVGDIITYAKGYLIGADGADMFALVGAGLPTMTYTPTAPNAVWDAIEEGDSFIYAAMWDGIRSTIFGIGIDTDGASLLQPVPLNRLPDGERALSLCSYAGFLLIGTSLGVRAAGTSASQIQIGSLIETDAPCYAFEPQGDFVWFSWSDHDSVTGLGRLDMNTFNGDAPSYATDIYASTVMGHVTSIITLPQGADRRAFAVNASGVWVETSTPVAEGWVDSGIFNWSLSDNKRVDRIEMSHDSAPTGTETELSLTADQTTSVLGIVSPSGTLSAQSTKGRDFELRVTLRSSAGHGPVLARWTALMVPIPALIKTLVVPIRLFEKMEGTDGTPLVFDINAEKAYLDDLRGSQDVVTYLGRGRAELVSLTDFEDNPDGATPDQQAEQGVINLLLTTVR